MSDISGEYEPLAADYQPSGASSDIGQRPFDQVTDEYEPLQPAQGRVVQRSSSGSSDSDVGFQTLGQSTDDYEPLQPAYESLQPAYEPLQPAYEPLEPAYEPLRPAYEPVRPVQRQSSDQYYSDNSRSLAVAAQAQVNKELHALRATVTHLQTLLAERDRELASRPPKYRGMYIGQFVDRNSGAIICEMCYECNATRMCLDCGGDHLCELCDFNQHRSLQTHSHQRAALPSGVVEGVILCEFCGVKRAVWTCAECINGRLCEDCDDIKHRNKKRNFHHRFAGVTVALSPDEMMGAAVRPLLDEEMNPPSLPRDNHTIATPSFPYTQLSRLEKGYMCMADQARARSTPSGKGESPPGGKGGSTPGGKGGLTPMGAPTGKGGPSYPSITMVKKRGQPFSAVPPPFPAGLSPFPARPSPFPAAPPPFPAAPPTFPAGPSPLSAAPPPFPAGPSPFPAGPTPAPAGQRRYPAFDLVGPQKTPVIS